MLNINPEIVCGIIQKARELHAKEGGDGGDEPLQPTDEDWNIQILTDNADDLTYQELKMAIEDLEPDQQVELVSLMWLGRDDFDIENWGTALKEAAMHRTVPTADYLLATPLLADYLAEGLVRLGYSCQES